MVENTWQCGYVTPSLIIDDKGVRKVRASEANCLFCKDKIAEGGYFGTDHDWQKPFFICKECVSNPLHSPLVPLQRKHEATLWRIDVLDISEVQK